MHSRSNFPRTPKTIQHLRRHRTFRRIIIEHIPCVIPSLCRERRLILSLWNNNHFILLHLFTIIHSFGTTGRLTGFIYPTIQINWHTHITLGNNHGLCNLYLQSGEFIAQIFPCLLFIGGDGWCTCRGWVGVSHINTCYRQLTNFINIIHLRSTRRSFYQLNFWHFSHSHLWLSFIHLFLNWLLFGFTVFIFSLHLHWI